eukprot:1060684-Amphidinium_carterae.2
MKLDSKRSNSVWSREHPNSGVLSASALLSKLYKLRQQLLRKSDMLSELFSCLLFEKSRFVLDPACGGCQHWQQC